MAKIAILGGGFIGRFYAESLTGRRGRDTVEVVFSRSEASAVRFSQDYKVPHFFTDMEEAVRHADAEIVI
ncbi:MAG TPA: Gfo/Idh/MocA family oxidoreductase, partial [Dyadobacter sp.]|nr:Gfo/Idh/MocA family oxidoreductase [Dyadobacter sp.]